jgi:hypothetical protein
MMLALLAPARAAELPGVGRVEAGGQIDGLAVIGTEGGKNQRPELLGTVRFDVLPPARWLRARLEVRGRIGGPFEGGPGIGIYDFERAFQNHSPSFEVREGWLEARARRAELRLGVQQLAWGRLDGVPPTDVVNPRDYHDPIVWDAEERKIGIPAATGTAFLPDGLGLTGTRLTLAWLPWGVPCGCCTRRPTTRRRTRSRGAASRRASRAARARWTGTCTTTAAPRRRPTCEP